MAAPVSLLHHLGGRFTGRSFAALWGVNCARSAVSRPPATGMVQVKMLSEGAKGLCHLLPTWLLHALFRVTVAGRFANFRTNLYLLPS